MDNVINIDPLKTLTPEQAQEVLDLLQKLVKLGKGLAALTPTTVDDDVLNVLDKVISFAAPYVQDGTIIDLLNLVLALFQKNGPAAVLQKLKDALAV
jgi:hypothetical protein